MNVLVKGKERCTLQVHPDDAARSGWPTAARARVTSPGSIEAPVEVTDEMMPRRRQPAARLGSRPGRASAVGRPRPRRRQLQPPHRQASSTHEISGNAVRERHPRRRRPRVAAARALLPGVGDHAGVLDVPWGRWPPHASLAAVVCGAAPWATAGRGPRGGDAVSFVVRPAEAGRLAHAGQRGPCSAPTSWSGRRAARPRGRTRPAGTPRARA